MARRRQPYLWAPAHGAARFRHDPVRARGVCERSGTTRLSPGCRRLREQLEARERLLFPEAEDWRAAWSAYAADPPGGPGLVDQLSFAVMRRFGLREAFTNDRHFRDAGFEPLF